MNLSKLQSCILKKGYSKMDSKYKAISFSPKKIPVHAYFDFIYNCFDVFLKILLQRYRNDFKFASRFILNFTKSAILQHESLPLFQKYTFTPALPLIFSSSKFVFIR